MPPADEPLATVTWSGIGTPIPAAGDAIGAPNLNQLAEVGRWGKGQVLDAAYTPDGQELFVLTRQGVYLYDAATATELEFRAYRTALGAMALSPDGRTLALSIASYFPYIELRDARTHAFLGSFFPFDERTGVSQLTFDQSGQTLFVKSRYFVRSGQGVPPFVVAWELATLQPIARLDPAESFVFAPQVSLAITVAGEELSLWSWGEGQFSKQQGLTLPEPLRPTETGVVAALSPDGRFVAVGDNVYSQQVALWDVASSTQPIILRPRPLNTQGRRQQRPAAIGGPGRDHVNDLRFSPDSQLLAVTSGYQDLTIWRASDGQRQQGLALVGDFVRFSPDGQLVATWQHTLSQWRLGDGAFVNVLKQHIGAITDLLMIPNSAGMAIASADGFVYLRDRHNGGLITSLRAGVSNNTFYSSPSVRDLDVSADGLTLVTASNDAFRVWNLADYAMTVLQPAPRGDIGASQIVISADGQTIVGQEHDTQTFIWTAPDYTLSGAGYYSPNAMAYSPTANLLATTTFISEDPVLWLPDQAEERRLPLPAGMPDDGDVLLQDLAFSAGGEHLAAVTMKGHLLVWRIAAGEPRLVMVAQFPEGDNTYDGRLAFTPDSSVLAASAQSKIRFWEVSSGQLLASLATGSRVNGLAFTADGRYLVSGHEDGSVRLWAVP